jgi:hypothetical protein
VAHPGFSLSGVVQLPDIECPLLSPAPGTLTFELDARRALCAGLNRFFGVCVVAILSPLWGWVVFHLLTHGLRHGLLFLRCFAALLEETGWPFKPGVRGWRLGHRAIPQFGNNP